MTKKLFFLDICAGAILCILISVKFYGAAAAMVMTLFMLECDRLIMWLKK